MAAGLPPGHEDLIQDLELGTLLQAMADGDKFLHEVSTKVLLTCLDDPEAIRYRQQVLADCLAHPEVIRQIHVIAAGALGDKRRMWLGSYGGSYQSASSNLSGAISHLGGLRRQAAAATADRRRHAATFHSDGMRSAVRHAAA